MIYYIFTTSTTWFWAFLERKVLKKELDLCGFEGFLKCFINEFHKTIVTMFKKLFPSNLLEDFCTEVVTRHRHGWNGTFDAIDDGWQPQYKSLRAESKEWRLRQSFAEANETQKDSLIVFYKQRSGLSIKKQSVFIMCPTLPCRSQTPIYWSQTPVCWSLTPVCWSLTLKNYCLTSVHGS